MQIKDTI